MLHKSPFVYLRRETGLRSLLIYMFAPFVCVLVAGCDNPQSREKNSDELLKELSQLNSMSTVHDEKTIAAKAEKLLSNESVSSVHNADATTTQAPTKSDAVLVIDSVPDKPQQSLPVDDENTSPWMFDATKSYITWEVMYRANVPVGYTLKKSVSSNRGSEPVITNDFRSVLRFVKEGKEERRELIINSVERPNGELISLTTRAQTGSESQSVIARVNGSKAVLELTINQTKQQNVVEWDSKVRGPFAIEQSMMRNPMKDNESRLIRLLDPFSGRIVESRLDANAKYKSPIMLGKSKMLRETKVTTRDGGALNESTLWADEDGVILKSYIQSGDLRIFQVGEETYKEVESAFDLSFSTNRIMPLAIKPGKREAYLDAIEMENQVIYKFEQKRSDPYKSISNRCNQRKKSLDAFTSEITVFRLKNREELPAGVESSDEPTPSDLDLSGWLDAGNPIFNKMYVDFLLQFEDDDLHLKVLSAAKRLSEKFESVGFNNDVRKLAVALSTNRLNSVEQSMALIALLRKDKIPARLALGYVYDRNASEPTMVFQAWVEYHHAEWWWPIDPVNPTKTGMLDRIKLKELTSSSSDVRREITKVLELGNDGVVSYKD
jgi:hypothetical protein